MTERTPNAPEASPSGAFASPARRRFGAFLVPATLFLVFAGAQVTSHEAGLAVPDWPLSYGMLMPPMVGNIFYEHGHRMIAATVGLLTLVLALWTARSEPRAGVRRLAWLALALVVAQGLLGGLTVIFLLPTAVSVSHACLAQTFLCVIAALAWATSREGQRRAPAPGRAGVAGGLALAATLAVFVQLVLGALMRHTGAGLAVPFFPLSESGSLLPERVDAPVVIHMLHRGFALVVAAVVLVAAARVGRAGVGLGRHAAALALLVVAQFALGALTVLHGKAPLVTSLHVATGAALLVTSWLLTLRTWAFVPAAAAAPA